MSKHRFLGAALALGAAVAVVAWLAWVRSTSPPQDTAPPQPPQGAPVPVPQEMTFRLGRAADGLSVHQTVLLRNPAPGREVTGELRLTLPSPVGLEASLDGQRVAAQITGAAAGTAHVAVPVALRAEKAVLELAYRLPPEHSRLSWEIPWPLRRVDAMIPPDSGLSLRAARLDGRPLQAAAPGMYTAESVQAGAVLEVELGPAAEGSRAPALTLTRLFDAWNAAAREVAGERWQDYALVGFRVTDRSADTAALWHAWGELHSRYAWLDGTAAKEDGRILVLAVGGSPERRFTDEELAYLRPYYEILVALTQPGLTREGRAQALQRLMLDGDAAAVKERIREAESRAANRVSLGGVDYSVSILGSDAGPSAGTVRLEARLTGH